jgi:hypothetical protein
MPTETQHPFPQVVALFEKVVAALPGVERKGDTIPYTSLNGHMFSYVSKDGFVALRLPEKTRNEFITKYDTKLCVQYGITQKEYVVVPDSILKRTTELKKYFVESHRYVASLKPKPTTKKGPKR